MTKISLDWSKASDREHYVEERARYFSRGCAVEVQFINGAFCHSPGFLLFLLPWWFVEVREKFVQKLTAKYPAIKIHLVFAI